MIDTRHGIFGVGPHHVAVHASEVQEMFVLPEVRRPPGCPPWQRGLVSMRGAVLPALDLRLRLGLATDPRRCKFGQWYYAFQTEDPVLRSELARFEEPHARVHALAIQVAGLREAGRTAEARALVAEARQGLLKSGLVRSLGRWKGSPQPVLVLDLPRLSSLVG